MAPNPNQRTDPAQEQLRNEPLPPIDDDAEVDAPARAQRPRQEARDDDGGDHDLAPRRRGDDARDAIAMRYREINAAERGDDLAPAYGDADPDLAAPAAPAAPAVEPRSDDPELTLVVYGERLKRKRSELVESFDLEGLSDEHIIRVAQKEIAADQRLREAKEVADQRLPGDRPSSAGVETGDEPTDQLAEPRSEDADGFARERPPQRPDQAFDEEQLDEIVQRVQFGDADEAKEALRTFAVEIRKGIPTASPDEVLNQFEQRLAQRQHQTEIYEALKRFGDENPDLIKDQYLTTVGLDIAKDVMLEDLRAIPGMKEEYLAPIAHDRKAVATAHRAVRQQGHQVRNIDEVLSTAGDTMRSRFNLSRQGQAPGGSQPHQATPYPGQARERIARKELAPQQPRHGGARAAPAAASRPQTTLELVNEQRAQRGFKPV